MRKYKIRAWFYFAIIPIWLLVCLPFLVIGIGFAGLEIFSITGLFRDLILNFDLPSIQARLTGWVLLIFPFLILPFALRRRAKIETE